MRSSSDFEKLVYDKADVLSARERRFSAYRKTMVGVAAAVTVLTAVTVGFIGNQLNVGKTAYNSFDYSAGENDKGYTAGNAAKNDDVYNAYEAPQESIENYSEDYEDCSVDSVYAEPNRVQEDSAADSSLIDEVYEGLPVKIVYYKDHDTVYDDSYQEKYHLAEKVIDDENAVEDILNRLSECEQTEDNPVVSPSYGSFVIIREDRRHAIIYEKQYFIWENYVCVVEIGKAMSNNIDKEYYENHKIQRTYRFGMSEEFKNLMIEYFDADFDI